MFVHKTVTTDLLPFGLRHYCLADKPKLVVSASEQTQDSSVNFALVAICFTRTERF